MKDKEIKKLKPKPLKWKKICPGLYIGFVGEEKIMHISQVKHRETWYSNFTGYTNLKEMPKESLSRDEYRKLTTCKKAAEKEYQESYKVMLNHIIKISQ